MYDHQRPFHWHQANTGWVFALKQMRREPHLELCSTLTTRYAKELTFNWSSDPLPASDSPLFKTKQKAQTSSQELKKKTLPPNKIVPKMASKFQNTSLRPDSFPYWSRVEADAVSSNFFIQQTAPLLLRVSAGEGLLMCSTNPTPSNNKLQLLSPPLLVLPSKTNLLPNPSSLSYTKKPPILAPTPNRRECCHYKGREQRLQGPNPKALFLQSLGRWKCLIGFLVIESEERRIRN